MNFLFLLSYTQIFLSPIKWLIPLFILHKITSTSLSSTAVANQMPVPLSSTSCSENEGGLYALPENMTSNHKKEYMSVYSLHCSCVDSAFKLHSLVMFDTTLQANFNCGSFAAFSHKFSQHYSLVYVIMIRAQMSSRISNAVASGSSRPQKLK